MIFKQKAHRTMINFVFVQASVSSVKVFFNLWLQLKFSFLQIGKLQDLRSFLGDAVPVSIRKLAMISLMEVFKDIIPGYRVRLATDVEKQQSVGIFWFAAKIKDLYFVANLPGDVRFFGFPNLSFCFASLKKKFIVDTELGLVTWTRFDWFVYIIFATRTKLGVRICPNLSNTELSDVQVQKDGLSLLWWTSLTVTYYYVLLWATDI